MSSSPSLTIRIGAEASGAIQNLNQTTNHVRNLGSQVNNTTNHINHYNTTINQASTNTVGLENRVRGLSGSFGMLNAAISGISFGAAINEMATFETKMLSLKALTMANSQEMAQLEKQARSLGATTAFSAQEAAEAQGVLASAGLKTNEILTATPKILQLASAGALELSKAAEISVAAMHGMGLELKDLGHINDVLVQTASDYTINVEQLGHAFGETAVVAHTYGVSLEATASSLGILKESGMAAGSIGDALKSLFGALVNDTKQNTEVLARYTTGLDHHKMSYKDLNVETLGYTKVLQNLKDAHIGATDMTKLFGETASTAAIGLSEHISKIKDNEAAYIKLNGAAQRQSDILNQGLSKAWDALKGSLSEAALQFGDANAKIDETGKATGGLKAELTDLLQSVTGVIAIYENMGDEFARSNKLTDEQYEKLKNIAGELHLIGGAAGGIAAVTGAIWAANAAMAVFNATSRANPFVMGASMLGAGIGAGLAQRNEEQQKNIELMKKSNSVEEASLKIAQQREKMNSIKEKLKNVVSGGRTGEENQAQLKILEQRQAEQIYYANNPVKADTPVIEKHDQAIKNHSKSIDANTDSLKKSSAAHAGLSDAQRAVQKEQEGYKRLIESTPIGAYRAKMDELSNALKKGGIDQQTYTDLTVEAAAKYEKATVGIDKMTAAEKARQQAFEQTPRGKFEKSTEELRSQHAFMSSTDYANKQDEIGVAYLKESGQNKDAKTQADLATEAAKKYEEQIKKTTTANYELGGSGKMAFDGLLGGISSVAAAFTDFGSVMQKNAATFSEIQKTYDENMKRQGNTEEQKAGYTKQFAEERLKYEQATTLAEISGARSIAGATSKMFSEKSTARKAFHGIEMGLAVVEMAMSAKKMVVDVAAGAAKMFSQSGWAGFAGVAAMMAVMAGLGVAMGASDKVTDLSTPETSTTGSVLGSDSASTSIKSITDTLNSIHASEYAELKGINTNFQNLTKLTTTSLALALRDRGAFNYSSSDFKGSGVSAMAMLTGFLVAGLTGVLGAVLFGVGKVKYEAVGGGIVMNAQKLMLDGMEKQIQVFDYTKIKKTVTGWFSDSVTYFDVITKIDNPLTKLFQQIFSNVGTTLRDLGTDAFKDSSLFNADLTAVKIKLALKSGDKNNADNQKKIEDAINKASDDLASQAYGQYFAQFQQMGEGMYETTLRLASQSSVARAGFDKLGLTVGLSGLGLVSFSDSLARAFGGVKELKSGLDDLYNLFTSDDQKLLDAKKAVSDFMTSLEIPKGSNVPTSIKTDADAKSITNYLASEAAKVSSVLDVFKKTTNTKPEETSISKLTNSLAKALPKDDKEYLKIFEPKDITTDVLKNALKDTKYSLSGEIAGTKAISKAYQPLIDYAAANQKYLASSSVFNNAKYDQTLIENLSKLGLTMPDTIDGVTSFVSVLDYLNDSAANNVAAFNSLSKSTKLVTSEQSKAVDELKNFKKSVSDWVLNKQITQVGSPEYQFNAAKSAYESNLAILQNAGARQIDKSAAMSKITGAADAYISKISEMYATGSTGQTGITGASMISGIVNQVASLADVPDIATQQLTALNSIDSGVSSVATAITDLSLNLPNAANDSSTKTDETIKELKQQNTTLTDMVVELKALVTTQVNSNIQVQSTLTDIASQTTVTASATRLQALK